MLKSINITYSKILDWNLQIFADINKNFTECVLLTLCLQMQVKKIAYNKILDWCLQIFQYNMDILILIKKIKPFSFSNVNYMKHCNICCYTKNDWASKQCSCIWCWLSSNQICHYYQMFHSKKYLHEVKWIAINKNFK